MRGEGNAEQEHSRRETLGIRDNKKEKGKIVILLVVLHRTIVHLDNTRYPLSGLVPDFYTIKLENLRHSYPKLSSSPG